MKLADRVKKAHWSIRNEGPLVFAKKLVRFIIWLLRLAHYRLNPYLPPPLRIGGMKIAKDSDYFFVSNYFFQISESDLSENRLVQSGPAPAEIKTAVWFVPYFEHLAFGGIYTIFRFINDMAERGVKIYIVIYDNKYVDQPKTHEEIAATFPALKHCELLIYGVQGLDKPEQLPKSDIAVATLWTSAYLLLKYNQTKRKYYFIQDYEPFFYVAGPMFALAESTYRFGFKGIVNTPGLLEAVRARHGLDGESFTPAVDPRYYYPPKKPRDNKKVRIFFYARPTSPRNAFELGIVVIQMLLGRYQDRIEIVTAGAKWKESDYDLKGRITNVGLLKGLKEVGDLYRSCDIGFVYMLSKHPSYQPFEFMATGMATVSNYNEDNLWFLKDNENCLLAEPSPSAIAEKIGQLIEDEELRQRIADQGRKTVNTDWTTEVNRIWSYLNSGK